MVEVKTIEPKDLSEHLTKELEVLLKQHVSNFPVLDIKKLEGIINSGYSYVFIAQNTEGKIVGTVTLLHVPKLDKNYKTLIEDLVVDESERGKGIGKMLMKAVETKARQLGAVEISLTSKPHRVAANNLYKSLGYKVYETNNYKLVL